MVDSDGPAKDLIFSGWYFRESVTGPPLPFCSIFPRTCMYRWAPG